MAGWFTVEEGGQRSGQVSVIRRGLPCAMSRIRGNQSAF